MGGVRLGWEYIFIPVVNCGARTYILGEIEIIKRIEI